VAISFVQPIGATDPLRTGSYGKTLTFTLSTTAP
jgi:X-Pro dipeptidyl-peptidase